MFQCAENFLVLFYIGLAEYMTAFGMTDHDKADACFLKHQRRNLSCELSLFFPAHILCAQTDIFLVDCF